MKSKFKKSIFVTGHKGLVGSSFVRLIKNTNKFRILTVDRKKLDLENQKEVKKFFSKHKPDYVINAAALAGGIGANEKYCADFIEKNLAIQHNVIKACYEYKVKKMLFLGSSCIYPRLCKQPMHEKELLGGILEKTNEAYAIAKIAGLKMCGFYNKQYKTDFRTVMPTNIFGKNDKYSLYDSHVIPALFLKFFLAKKFNKNIVNLWGNGKAIREFIYVDDMVRISMNIFLKPKDQYNRYLKKNDIEFFNIGSGHEFTINKLAQKIKKLSNYKGKIKFDKKMKNGTPRKLLNIQNIKKFLGGKYPISNFDNSLKVSYQDFLKNSV